MTLQLVFSDILSDSERYKARAAYREHVSPTMPLDEKRELEHFIVAAYIDRGNSEYRTQA